MDYMMILQGVRDSRAVTPVEARPTLKVADIDMQYNVRTRRQRSSLWLCSNQCSVGAMNTVVLAKLGES